MAATMLVTGGTGTIGSTLLNILSLRGAPVRALVRSPAGAEKVRSAGAEPALGDFAQPDTLAAALSGIERAFLLSSPAEDQVALQTAFIAAASRAGVRYVVKLSVIGAADDADMRLGRWHREIERHLEDSGMAWTHLRPHSFMQNRLALAPVIARQGLLIAPAGEGAAPLVDTRDVAAVAAEILLGDDHQGAAYDVTGPEALTHARMAEELSLVLGRPVQYVNAPPEAARDAMIGMGLPPWLADDLIVINRQIADGKGGPVSDVVPRLTGHPGTTWAAFVADHADVFREASR